MLEYRLVITCFAFCRPDGQKKAYVRLASDYDALDVANKVCLLILIKAHCYVWFILQIGII